MDTQRASEELTVIRQLMERPVRYSTQSGLAGIVAGLAALAGCWLDAWLSGRFGQDRSVVTLYNASVWAGVFLVAFGGVVVLTRLRERKRDMPFWSSVKLRILKTILPPFIAGVGLTGAIVYRWYFDIGPNMWGLIPAVWMLFYGVACWQIGEFSVVEVRILGAGFILAGLVVAVLDHTNPYLSIGLTFGAMHIVYGIVVWVRHGG